MRFPQMPEAGRPVVILLHGGGLSDWSVAAFRHCLHEHFCVLTPILDGHGMDADTTFISIEDSAQKLLNFIDSHCGGHIFALFADSRRTQFSRPHLCTLLWAGKTALVCKSTGKNALPAT